MPFIDGSVKSFSISLTRLLRSAMNKLYLVFFRKGRKMNSPLQSEKVWSTLLLSGRQTCKVITEL